MKKYAGVVVDSTSISLDRVFTYKIPEKYSDKVYKGQRVLVPFGLGNKKILGFVLDIYDECDAVISGNIKEIHELIHEEILLREKDLELIYFLKSKYLCTFMEAIHCILPNGIFKNTKHKVEKVLSIVKKLEGKFLKEPYTTIYKVVEENNGVFTKAKLRENLGGFQSSIETLIKHNFLTISNTIVDRFDDRTFKVYEKKELNKLQAKAVDTIKDSCKNFFLIHGVTGSGKTEIYLHLAEEQIKEGKDVLILVPEISLTPQMVERFKGRLGKNVAVFHSRLSEGERYDEWFRVKNKKAKIAIGARSAIFMPFDNLGLIILDEEHEGSYKSDSDPKYSTKEVAFKLNEMYNCKVIFGSATPSIESYSMSKKGEIELIKLEERADGASLPLVKVIDMREELKSNNKSIFSRELYNSIETSLNNKEQVILFLNRRGFSSFVSCRKCGYVFKCKNCDISMTYHHNTNKLICHYCGNTENTPTLCPKCNSRYVKYFGVGTEKVEQEVKTYFKNAKTIRMDYDTTRGKNSYEKIYNSFKNEETNVLIGTQMIAKGLDFKNVTLVGILAADLSLNLPDFRASERTFQLITQVAGRAGRGDKEGKVVVQTYNPEHFSIKYSVKNEYDSFFNEELKIREIMNYPPYSDIFLINFTSKNENLLIKSTQNIGIILREKNKNYDNINMLGPCPCEVSKIKELYRWQVIFKGIISDCFAMDITKIVYNYLKSCNGEIRVSFDRNPNSLL